MTRRGILIASIVSLVLALAEAAILPTTINVLGSGTALSLVVALIAALAAGIAGRVIVGTRRVHRYYRAGVPILSAVAGFAFESAVSSWLISHDVVFGQAPGGVPVSVTVGILIGAVAYLGAATLYGFAGTSQGFRVRTRILLLVILLLSVIPFAAVLGGIGWVILSIVWKPTEATPAPAAASE
jgi:hypothetical protein